VTDLGKYRRLLEREKQRLEESIERLGEAGLDRTLGDSISEFSTYDNHPADVGTETFEREKDYGLRENQKTTLDMVEDALRRLDEGSYGRCRRCGRSISEARLEALPWAAYCLRCQAALEEGEARDWGRPAEEDVRGAFSSFTDDDLERPVGFDGEDSWQAVARSGTSNTPADTPPADDYDETYVGAGEDVGAVADIEHVPDTNFDPGQVGEEGTLRCEDGRIVSDRSAGAAVPRGRKERRRTRKKRS